MTSFRKSQLIDHPNVVRAIDTYKALDSEGRLRDYLVLQFVEGDVLGRIPSDSIAKQQALSYAWAFLDAITTSYRRGLAYVDLTTMNIMINSEKIVIIDLRGFEYVNDGTLCRMESVEQWLDSVLEIASEILKRGKWEHDEFEKVLSSLADVVRTFTAAPWCGRPLSEASADKVLDCLNAMSQKLSGLRPADGHDEKRS